MILDFIIRKWVPGLFVYLFWIFHGQTALKHCDNQRKMRDAAIFVHGCLEMVGG